MIYFLKKVFVIVHIVKIVNSLAFICNHFYAITVIRELNFDCRLANQADNACKYRNHNTKEQRNTEHSFYLLSKRKINITNTIYKIDITDHILDLFRLQKCTKMELVSNSS